MQTTIVTRIFHLRKHQESISILTAVLWYITVSSGSDWYVRIANSPGFIVGLTVFQAISRSPIFDVPNILTKFDFDLFSAKIATGEIGLAYIFYLRKEREENHFFSGCNFMTCFCYCVLQRYSTIATSIYVDYIHRGDVTTCKNPKCTCVMLLFIAFLL